MEVCARIWVKKDNKNFLGLGKAALLDGISKSGSISKSAKNMRMSYKAAWDSIQIMNDLSPMPLVDSMTGGKSGGGTKITQEGKKAIDAYLALHEVKDMFCAHFEGVQSLDELCDKALKLQNLIKTNLKSCRNLNNKNLE